MTDTEATVRPIIVEILAEHESWAYLLHPELPVRPATADEMAALMERARAEYEDAMAAPEPEPEPVSPPLVIARRFPPAPVAAPVPDPESTPADGIAAMAAERHAGVGELTTAQEAAFTAFTSDSDAQDQREATATMPVIDATSTQAIAAVTDGGTA